MHKLIAPAILIFLVGIGVGFSLFPHVMPQAMVQNDIPMAQQVPLAEPEPTTLAQDDAIPIPALPEQKPLTSHDQEEFVLQLFSPTSTQVSEMQTESEQMKLLEQTMMISFLLSNCGQMTRAEYKQTYVALVKYLTNNGDANPTVTASDAAKRAQASYRMVYRHVPCDDPSLEQMADSLAQWRNSVSTSEKR